MLQRECKKNCLRDRATDLLVEADSLTLAPLSKLSIPAQPPCVVSDKMADDVPVLLSSELHLYLRHVAKITIAVLLPEMKGMSVSISNWEVMEKLRSLAAPEVFAFLRVGKTTRQLLYFEGELSSLRALRKTIVSLNGKSIKLNGLSQQLKVRAGETDLPFPSKKDWETYFQDRHVPSFDEGVPGDRCDTVTVQGIPTQWMVPPTASLPFLPSTASVSDKVSRSDFISESLSKVFSKFGKVSRVDVAENSSDVAAGNFSSFGPSAPQLTFDGFIQYEEYASFCSAMAGLRGMKLVRRCKGEPELSASIAVDFDKTSHMSDRSVRKRRKELERLYDLELAEKEKARAALEAEKKRREERIQTEKREKEEVERKRKAEALAEAERRRQEKEQRRREQEERRRQEREQRRAAKEALRLQRLAEKEAEKEKQLLLQQRRVEAERLLKQLLLMASAQRQLEIHQEQEEEAQRQQEQRAEQRKQERAAYEAARKKEAEKVVQQRDALMKQVKSMEDRKLELQRHLLRRKLANEKAQLQASHTDRKV